MISSAAIPSSAACSQIARARGCSLFFSSVADVVKPDSAQAVEELKNMGIHVIMLTGDNRRTAEAVRAQVGIDAVVSDVPAATGMPMQL